MPAMWKRISVLWALVKGDARKLWFALQHPRSPVWLKLGSAFVALYLVSPIDLIPDMLPVLGLVDDLVLVPLAIRMLLKLLPADIRAWAEARAAGRAAPEGSASPGGAAKKPLPLVDRIR